MSQLTAIDVPYRRGYCETTITLSHGPSEHHAVATDTQILAFRYILLYDRARFVTELNYPQCTYSLKFEIFVMMGLG
jgi:hypothetical protein